VLKGKSAQQASQGLMYASLGAVLLAAIGATGTDIWLASTQWLLIAAVFIGFGIYLKS